MEPTVTADTTLQRTVSVVCELLADDSARRRRLHEQESTLRAELVACLLSSQVQARSVDLAMQRLGGEGLLSDARWCVLDSDFEHDVTRCLGRRDDGYGGAYRFPGAKGRQIAQIRSELLSRPLVSRISNVEDVRQLRKELIRDLIGIGPKQASMFLRNVGISYDLAILDVHVLKFMQSIDLLPTSIVAIGTLAAYERVELVVKEYAKTCEHPVGYLDWAIWITMQALKELKT